MFKFLKDKLKQAVSAFSKKVDEDEGVKKEEVAAEPIPEPIDEELAEERWQADEEAQRAKKAAADKAAEAAMAAAEKLAAEERAKREAEEKRILEERQKKEAEERKKEEERLRFLDEEQRRKEEARLAEERRRRDENEKKLLEEKRRADERRRDQEEAARIAHRKLLEEESRKEEERINEERRKAAAIRAEQERLAAEERARKEEAERKAEAEKKKGFFQKLFSKKEEKPVEKKPEPKSPRLILEKEEFEKVDEDYAAPIEQEVIEEKGFFGKIKESLTTIKLSEEKFNELFWDLEMGMLENNVAVEVIEKIKEDLRDELTTGKVSRKSVDQIVHDTLKKSIEELFSVDAPDLVRLIKSKADKPYVIAFIGVNGSGKTTTMAKVAHMLLKNKLSVVFAASDTFRAAAIQQLQEHADKLGVKMIRHDYESDPAAVAFDAVKHAKAKGIDVVMIDTAGRLHTNDNLMNELKKLIRVNKPDMKIFIGEAITGNDCVEQAKLFNEAVGIDGIILAKADVDEKGGAALSVSFVTGKPIMYMGTGQTYDDLVPFRPELVLENIGL